jgi:hypothetical protein
MFHCPATALGQPQTASPSPQSQPVAPEKIRPTLSPPENTAMQAINPAMPAAMPIDTARVADAGVFVSAGNHITLYSDIDDQRRRQRWVSLFDAAVVQWCQRFDINIAEAQQWRLTAVVMQDETRIRNAGLIPDDLPEFPAGFNRGHEFWVYLQKDDYYTRHLILHEGTHAFMQWFLSSSGPPWYSEGMAEWIALHRWDGDRQTLRLNQTITDKQQTPGWGRIQLLKKQLGANKVKSLDDLLLTPPTAFRDVNAYAWSWAACEFLAHHPLSKQTFARLPRSLSVRPLGRFNLQLRNELNSAWETLSRDWLLYIYESDYGTDIAAAAIKPAKINDDGSYEISAQSSWQSTPITVEPGDQFTFTATGEFIVGQTTIPWRCRPNGITVEYYDGRPLGMLMAAVIPKLSQPFHAAPVEPVAIGTSGSGRYKTSPPHAPSQPVSFNHAGQLAFRINESPAKLGDNRGSLKVTIEKLK